MRKVTKVGEKYIIQDVDEQADVQQKIIEAIHRIEKQLGLPETDFGGDDNASTTSDKQGNTTVQES